MIKNSNSTDALFHSHNPAYDELNLIGLKTRFALRDKPLECRSICLEQSIPFNRTYGSNLFEKLSHTRNTFKDFDHIIVPKYKKKQSLKDFIATERNRMTQVNHLNSLLTERIPCLNMQAKTLRKQYRVTAHSKNVSKEKDKVVLKQNDIYYYRNQMNKERVTKSLESNNNKQTEIAKTTYPTPINILNKQLALNMRAFSLMKTGQNGYVPWKTFCGKNDYVFTPKGGLIHTGSLWRSKNINNIHPYISDKSTPMSNSPISCTRNKIKIKSIFHLLNKDHSNYK